MENGTAVLRKNAAGVLHAGVLRPDVSLHPDLLRNHLDAFTDLFADPLQLMPTGTLLLRFRDVVYNIYSGVLLISGFAARFATTMGRNIDVLFLQLIDRDLVLSLGEQLALAGRYDLSRTAKTPVEKQIQSFVENAVFNPEVLVGDAM